MIVGRLRVAINATLEKNLTIRRKTMNYRHGFLVATLNHAVESPFYKSVLYVCEHAPSGALALILNKNLQLNLADLLKKKESFLSSIEIFLGGHTETQQKGFVLHQPFSKYWEGTTELCADLHMTTTNDILQHITPRTKQHYKIFLGYTSFAPFELEQHIAQDFWMFIPYKNNLMWAPYQELWSMCYDELQLQPHLIGGVDAGLKVVH
jgi:putative transcriptional regulator